jgi:hypothetical protein
MSCRACGDKDASADDGADSEGRELHRAKHTLQPVIALHLFEQYVERFSCKQLITHSITSKF